MSFAPPALPWVRGVQTEYTAFTLDLHVCSDHTGRVWSYHEFQTPEDEAASLKLLQGGAQQVAYALLTEAYRRESFVVALVEMSKDPEFLSKYREGSPEIRSASETKLAQAAQEVMRRTLEKMGTDVPREILAMLQNTEGKTA